MCIFYSRFCYKISCIQSLSKIYYDVISFNKKEQVDAWTDIYVHMKRSWILSLILGLIAYILLGVGFKNLI